MITINLKDALNELRAVVAEAGTDFVYRDPAGRVPGGMDPEVKCLYVHGDRPGCIVGHVLNRLGVPLEEMEPFDLAFVNSDIPTSAGTLVDQLVRSDVIDVGDAGALGAVLGAAQEAQDAADDWGYALRRAEARYDSLVGSGAVSV